ncbi:MAG: thioesterase family protein, partial [Pseudomonadota bacterium]
DYNGHLNMAFYNVIFDRGVDHIFDYLDIGEAYARSGVGSGFIVQAHVQYLQELSLHDEVEVHFQLLDYDKKRLHFIEQLFHREQGYLAATSEQLGIHVDMQTRRATAFPDPVLEKLAELSTVHSKVPTPAQAGQLVRIKKP